MIISPVISIRCFDTGNDIDEEQLCGVEFYRPPAQKVTGYCSLPESVRLFEYIKLLPGWHIRIARSPKGIWNAGKDL